MPNRTEVINYFRSIIHQDKRVKVCHRCGRLMNYERVIVRKDKKQSETLRRLKVPLKLLKWHKFKLCESCFEDKENNVPCPIVDLEHVEEFNLTYRYLHKQL